MMTLKTIQAEFCHGLSPFADPEQQARAAELIQPAGALGNAQRLAIYRHNVSGGHVAVLEQVFPVCREIIGEQGFAALSREYTWRYPSDDGDLNHYGETFPQHLHQRVPQLPYLLDLGLLELHWHQAWFAEDPAEFDFAAFAEAAESGATLRFSTPSGLYLLQSEWPVQALWDRHRAGEAPRELPVNEEADRLVIGRAGMEVALSAPEPELFRLLQRVRQGDSLQRLAEQDATRTLVQRLPELIARGWICGFSTEEPGGD